MSPRDKILLRRLLTAVVCYIVVGLLTYGWVYNHHVPRSEQMRTQNAAVAGVMWPLIVPVLGLYYGGELAKMVTKWP